MHSETLRTATGLCCSLLGNAGRALARGGAGGRAGCASMLWLGLRTQTLRAACPEAETWVQSPPHRCSQKRVHNKGCWCRSRLGASQQPQPTPLPLASQPALPHAGASFLHVCSVALTLALLSACNVVTFSKLLWMEGRAITPTIHVRNRHAGQPRDPPRVTGQHMDEQRCLSKDPSLFLAACFFDHCSVPQSCSLLSRPQEGLNYIWLQLCKTGESRSHSMQGSTRPCPRVSAGLWHHCSR